MRTTKSSRILNLPGKGLWSQVRVCICCGNFVVRLRLPGNPRKKVTCYFKGWDGSPWYTAPANTPKGWFRGNAKPHKIKRQRVEIIDLTKPKDPFFSLDVEE